MKIECLFPEVSNLYGDLLNVRYLVRCCKESGVDVEVIKTSLKSEPLFASETPALIYMGPMSERAQKLALSALYPYKARLQELIENGTPFLITGNALELFGEYIETDDGSRINCLSIFPTYAKQQMLHRFNALYLGTFENFYITGHKSQFSHSYTIGELDGLFYTIRGVGLNPSIHFEGIRKNNYFATYLLGPILFTNPQFARYFMKLIGIEDPTLCFEDAITAAYNQRLKEFMDRNTTLD